MNYKHLFAFTSAVIITLTSCKEKTTVTTSSSDQSGNDGVQQVTDPDVSDTIKPPVSAEDRAAKLGFAKHLPKTIVKYDGIFKGKEAFQQFLKSPIGTFALQRMADVGISLEDLMKSDDAAGQIAQYSEEYFTAYGPGTSESFDLAINLLNRLAYYGGRTGVHMADGFVREGDAYKPDEPYQFIKGPLKGASKEVVKMFQSFNMPAVYQGCKVSDADTRELVVEKMEQMTSLFGMAEEASEPITIKRGGNEFSGFKVSGAKMAEQMDEADTKEMQKIFGIEETNALIETLAKKSIVCVTGTIDNYVIFFLGKSEEDFVFAENISDSMCANEEIAFLDKYLDKNIISLGYSGSKVIESAGKNEALGFSILNSFTKGLSDGLGDAGSLGDTQDIEALLGSITDQGEKLVGMFDAADLGYVAYIEDGLKAEGFGGGNMPSIDFNQAHTLASLGDGDNTLLFANWTSNEAYNEKVMEYVDSIGETSYLLTKRIAALDVKAGGFGDFSQGVKMFDNTFKNDAIELWKALRGDLAAGLGAESALVVDVNGVLPKIPNVPDIILQEGKMPRIGYVSTVDDRTKLQSSWTRVNSSAENILKTISQMAGEEIPMQVPMSSEKDGLKTWFVPIPFQNDDFVPSVSVSDDLFFVSTSKQFSEGLAERFKTGDKSDRKGAWLHIDFKMFNGFAKQWMDLVEKNADEIIPGESARADFTENKPMIEGALKAFGSLDSLTLNTRNEDGRTRVSLHLKAQ